MRRSKPLSPVLLTTKVRGTGTVNVSARLVTPASDAVIALVPGAWPLATPVALIVATDGVADAQVTRPVISPVEPSANVPVAVNCPGSPTCQLGSCFGETTIATTCGVGQAERGRCREAPLAVAETVQLPARPLFVAVTLAVPLALMVAGLPVSSADAPLAGGVNVTRPPATGSIELLAGGDRRDQRWREPTGCPGRSPEVTAMMNPLDSKAPDVHGAVDDPRQSALVGGDSGGNEGVIAGAQGRAAGQQGHGLGRPAVMRCPGVASIGSSGVAIAARLPGRRLLTQPLLPKVSCRRGYCREKGCHRITEIGARRRR